MTVASLSLHRGLRRGRTAVASVATSLVARNRATWLEARNCPSSRMHVQLACSFRLRGYVDGLNRCCIANNTLILVAVTTAYLLLAAVTTAYVFIGGGDNRYFFYWRR